MTESATNIHPLRFSRWVEGLHYLAIPACYDEEDRPYLPVGITCQKCAEEIRLLASDAKLYTDAMGYKNYAVRLHYYCKKCQESYIFRVGGDVVENGEYVKAETETMKDADNQHKCLHCQFFLDGECHRYPPIHELKDLSKIIIRHGRVDPNNWCGEWRNKG